MSEENEHGAQDTSHIGHSLPELRSDGKSLRGGTCSFLFSVLPSAHPGSQLVQGPEHFYFAHPPRPVIAKGLMMRPAFSDPHQLAPGPTRPSRPHLENTNPSFSIEKHFVLLPDLYAVVQLSHFLPPCHYAMRRSPSLPAPHQT